MLPAIASVRKFDNRTVVIESIGDYAYASLWSSSALLADRVRIAPRFAVWNWVRELDRMDLAAWLLTVGDAR